MIVVATIHAEHASSASACICKQGTNRIVRL